MSITAGDVQYMIGADLSEFTNALSMAEATIKDTAKTLSDEFGKTAQNELDKAAKKASELKAAYTTIGTGLAVGGAAITAAFGLATASAATFESGLTKLSTLGIENAADMQRIEDKVRSLATTYGTSLADGMEGAFTALSLFGNTSEGVSQALVFMEENAKAATAGYASFSDIVRTSTSVISAYNLTGNDTSTILNKVSMAANVSLVDVKDLAGVVGTLSPAFSSAGVSIDEMLASMATATNVNQNVSEVATRMTAMLKGITGPAINVREQFDELGITWGANALTGTTLHDWLVKLADKTKGNAQALRDLFPDQEAYQGVMLLLNEQTQKLAENTDKVSNSTGTYEEMLAKVMANDPTIQWGKFKNSLNDLAITVGQALLPAFQDLTGAIAPIVSGIAEWAKAHPTLTTVIVATTAGLGALSLTLGTVLLAITPVAAAIAALTTVTGLTVAGLAAFALPAAAVVAALAAIGAGVYTVYTNWDELWPAIKEIAISSWDAITGAISAGWNWIVQTFSSWDGIKAAFQGVWDGLKAIVNTGMAALREAFSGMSSYCSSWVDTIIGYFNHLLAKATAIWESISSAVTGPIETMMDYMSSFGESMREWFGQSEWIDYMENLSTQSESHFSGFEDSIMNHLDGTSSRMTRFGEELNRFYTGVLGATQGYFNSVSESISDYQDIFNAAVAKLGSSANVYHEWYTYLQREQRKAIGGFEANFRTLSDFIRDILGITEEKLAAYAEESAKVYDGLNVQFVDKTLTAFKYLEDGASGSMRTLATAAQNTATAVKSSATNIAASVKSALSSIGTLAKAKGFATGGVTDHPLVMVGERGPELAALPVGTRVLSHEDMMSAASMGVRGYADGGVITNLSYENVITDLSSVSNVTLSTKLLWVKQWVSELKSAMARGQKEFDLLYAHMSDTGSSMAVETLGTVEVTTQNITAMENALSGITAKTESFSGLLEDATQADLSSLQGWHDRLTEALASGQEQIQTFYTVAIENGKLGIVSLETVDVTQTNIDLIDAAIAALSKSSTGSLSAITKSASSTAQSMKSAANSIVNSVNSAISSINKLSATRTATGYASGGVTDHPLVMVGERGPELAALPVGTRVLSHSDMMRATSMGVHGLATGGQVQDKWGNDQQSTYIDKLRTLLTPDEISWATKVKHKYLKSAMMDTAAFMKAFPRRKARGTEYIPGEFGSYGTFEGTSSEHKFTRVPSEYYDLVIWQIKRGFAKAMEKDVAGSSGSTTSSKSGEWLPSLGNELMDSGISKLLGYANGGVTGSRICMVGERGPELAALPVGTRVMSHMDMMRSVAGYANGGVVGSRAAQALADGGLVDFAGGGSSNNSTTLTINSPLVQVDRVNASDTQDVDKFVKKVSDVFMRQLSSMGLSLNAVGRA